MGTAVAPVVPFHLRKRRCRDNRQDKSRGEEDFLRLADKTTRKRQIYKEKVITIVDMTNRRLAAIKSAK
ncbi:MAG: hypothetical protein BHW39_09575 [Firmicutes bacterium CAG:552_39_19]|nr:MAG: hypothetical protein BHW39_09575 [Firmicutes bacterium CAG:552_39_19]